MGYQINHYRNEWHTRDRECCNNCDTAKNPVYTNPEVAEKHALMTGLIGTFLGYGITGLEYFGNKAEATQEVNQTVPKTTTPIKSRSADVEEKPVEIEAQQMPEVTKETSIEKENNVKNLLGADKFNNLSAEIKADVLKKYETIKAYSQQNNIEISDTELSRRLNSYIKALNAKAKEVEMARHFEAGGAIENFNDSIVDEDIRELKDPSKDINQYIQALLNRGTGSVQLFDENGDNRVTEKEYLQGQAKEYKKLYGEKLSSKMEEATKKTFNKLNRDKTTDSSGNQFLSEAEFATHEFAKATLGDTDKNTTEELTIRESLLSSMILDKPGIEEKYDYGSDKIWEVMKKFK